MLSIFIRSWLAAIEMALRRLAAVVCGLLGRFVLIGRSVWGSFWSSPLAPDRGEVRRGFGRLLLILLFARLIDPTGIEGAIADKTSDLTARFLAPPAENRCNETVRAGCVTVVLIDDRALAGLGKEWPLPFGVYDSLIKTIASYEPASIFFDIIFRNLRDDQAGMERLAGTIRSIRDGTGDREGRPKVPVLLGDLFGEEYPKRSCPSDELPHHPTEFPAGNVQIPSGPTLRKLACAASAVVPLRLPAPRNTYPARVRAEGCGGYYPTPAFLLAAIDDARAVKPQNSEPLLNLPRCASAPPDAIPDAIQDPVFVLWGHGITEIMRRSVPGWAACKETSGITWLVGIEAIMTGLFPAMAPASASTACLPMDTISLYDVRLDGSSQAEQLRRDTLHNRHVIIGIWFDAGADTHISPLHGRVPGVYVHAAALSTLLSDRQHYFGGCPDLC